MRSVFRRTLGLTYYTSAHKAEYDRIAHQLDLSPRRIYRLAHGRHSKNQKDREAKNMLANKGMLWDN